MADELEQELEEEAIVDEAEDETEAEDEVAELDEDQGEDDHDDGEEAADEADDEPEELIIEIEGQEPEEVDDNETIRSLRQANKDLKARLKEQQKAEPAQKLRQKPTLEDHDYDTDAFADDLLKWNEEKREVEAAQAQQQAEIDRQLEAFEKKRSAYQSRKAELRVKDIDDVEATVAEVLPENHQSILISVSKDPAVTMLALGRNPKIMADMAKLDPLEFAYKLAELESKMKTSKKSKPAPEKRLEGGKVSVPGASEKTLAKLREEARKTGDMSKVIAHRRKMAAAK